MVILEERHGECHWPVFLMIGLLQVRGQRVRIEVRGELETETARRATSGNEGDAKGGKTGFEVLDVDPGVEREEVTLCIGGVGFGLVENPASASGEGGVAWGKVGHEAGRLGEVLRGLVDGGSSVREMLDVHDIVTGQLGPGFGEPVVRNVSAALQDVQMRSAVFVELKGGHVFKGTVGLTSKGNEFAEGRQAVGDVPLLVKAVDRAHGEHDVSFGVAGASFGLGFAEALGSAVGASPLMASDGDDYELAGVEVVEHDATAAASREAVAGLAAVGSLRLGNAGSIGVVGHECSMGEVTADRARKGHRPGPPLPGSADSPREGQYKKRAGCRDNAGAEDRSGPRRPRRVSCG
ncbi:hypothetical protein ES705_29094 [subsurface metagenome]